MTTTINASTSSGLVNTADTSGILQLQTASTAAVTIDASQNVGIGTASPTAKVQINGSGNSNVGVFVGNASLLSSAPTYTGSLRIVDNPTSTASNGGLEFMTATFGSGYGSRIASLDSSGISLTFQTRQNSATWSEMARFNSSSEFLVGTTSSSFIYAGSSTTTSKAAIYTTGYDNLNLISTVNPTLNFSSPNSSSNIFRFAGIQGIMTNTTAGSEAGALTFNTATGSANIAERMRIDSSGNVMMGTTSPNSTCLLSVQKSSVSSGYGNGQIANVFNSGATSTTKGYNSVLRVASNGSGADCNIIITDNTAYNYNFGGYQGTLYCMAGSTGGVGLAQNGTSWSSLSDVTLKNVTGTYTNALADIAQIEPVKFTWKDDVDNKPCVGVIAQSVQKVIPEAIESTEEGILSVRYTDIIPILVASIQELNAKVDAQAAEIAALKGAK